MAGGFLDVENVAGGEDECAGVPSEQAITFLALNLLNNGLAASSLFPSLTNLWPNPGSQLAWAPATNLREGPRQRAYIAGGLFIFGDDTLAPSRGSEMAPNYNFRLADTGGTVNVDIRTATPTTYFSDGYAAAAALQTALNASALNGTFTVTYAGRLSASPTYKFTIASTENFTVTALRATDANSGFVSIGFTTNRSGAAIYTGDVAAIHTEETLVIDLGDTSWTLGATTRTSRYSWLYLVDCNYTGSADGADPLAYGANKFHVYLGVDKAAVDNKSDASFTENRTMFKLGRATKGLGLYEGTDSGVYLMRSTTAAGGAHPCRLWAINLQRWRRATQTGSNAYAPDFRYVRIKVVDRSNPQGALKIGKAFIGPGITFEPPGGDVRNWAWGSPWTPVDRSEVSTNQDGGVVRRFREPSAKVDARWGKNNPLTDTQAALLASLIRARRAERVSGALAATPGLDCIISDPRVALGNSRPVAVIDPTLSFPLSDATVKYGASMFYGTGSFSDLTPLGVGWGARFSFEEEAL